MEKIDLTIEEIRTLILDAVMTGNQTNKIDIENAPNECPIDVAMACEFVLSRLLNNKIEELKANDIDNAIKDLLKGTN